MDERQQEHQEDLKAKFCVASEMIAKLFLGHNQSHYNGAVSMTSEIRKWCQEKDDVIPKKDLLSFLDALEPPPTSASVTKEQCSFDHTRKRGGVEAQSVIRKRQALVSEVGRLTIT